MSKNNYDIQSSRAITTRGFQTDPIFMEQAGDREELAKMQRKAILDAVAQQVMQRKTKLAMVLEAELVLQVKIMFLEDLEASDELLVRAEKLKSRHAYRRYVDFLANLWDQYEALLYHTALEGGRHISQIAVRSPFPDPEVRRSWFQRTFQGG